MENYFKKFQYFYQKENIKVFFKKMIEENKVIFKPPWLYADSKIVLENRDILPMSHVLKRDLSVNDVGLALMISSTKFHINPKNNGLIIFPLVGTLKFNFEDKVQTIVDSPTIVNGKINHRYFPIDGVSMFYAIKIPPEISWIEICSNATDDR
jgi:hypothetical protein